MLSFSPKNKLLSSRAKSPLSNALPGFTLIELLVSIAVFAIITALIIANFKFKAPADALNIGAEQLIASFRQAQTATFTGIKLGARSLTYGLYLSALLDDNKKLIIFADSNQNNVYDVGVDEINPANCFNCGTFSLPNKIEVSALQYPIGTALNDLDIVFSATNTEEIYLNGVLAGQNAAVTLVNTQTSEIHNLTIYYTTAQISR